MSDNEKGKNLPLPSIFSNIRNAGRSSIFQQHDATSRNRPLEIEPLVSELSSLPPSPSSIPSSKRRNTSSFSFLLDKVQSMPMFDKSRSRIRSRSSKRSKRGFKVDLPPRFLLYTIFVFIVCPLVLGGFFLVKQILFGSLQEDETHPLHKKKPHLYTGANVTNNSYTSNVVTGDNMTESTSNQRLQNSESSAEKELESHNLLQTDSADTTHHQQQVPFSDIPSDLTKNTSFTSNFPTSAPSNELE
jgi:hypothetical protein